MWYVIPPNNLKRYSIKFFLFLLLLPGFLVISAAQSSPGFIDSLLHTQPDQFSHFYTQPEYFRLQIIYSTVDHRDDGSVQITDYTYRTTLKEYFNPASTVKLPLMLMVLDKLNRMPDQRVNKFTRLSVEKNHDCQKEATADTTSPNGYPNFANYIAKILLYSNNDAYNRLYEFLGQAYIRAQLDAWGMKDAKIVHRFDRDCDQETNRYTNAFNFYDANGNLLYRQPTQYNAYYQPETIPLMIGNNEELKGGKLSGQGKDFANSNALPLSCLHQLIVGFFYPEAIPFYQNIHLTEEDRLFIGQHLGLYPRESPYTRISDTATFHDSYKKYLLYGQDVKHIPDSGIRVFNMVGQSYGFLTDAAYIVDFRHHRDFFLSATLYVNSDGVINDNKYDYVTLGFPFLKALGKLFLHHEQRRPPQDGPHLQRWQEWLAAGGR